MALGDLILTRLRATLRTRFGVGRGTLDLSALTAARTFTFPDADAVIGAGGSPCDLLSPLTASEVSVSAGTTLTSAAFGRMHVASGTTSDYTVTLPSVSGNAGKIVGVRMASALTRLVTIDAGSGVLIDGQQTRVMWSQESAVLLCTGAAWVKVAGKSRPVLASATMSADATAIAQGARTKINLDTALFDNTGRAVDATNGGLLAWRGGSYRIYTYIYFATNGDPLASLTLSVGVAVGRTVSLIRSTVGVASFNGNVVPQGEYLVTAVAGDRHEMYIQYFGDGTSTGTVAKYDGKTAMFITELDPW